MKTDRIGFIYSYDIVAIGVKVGAATMQDLVSPFDVAATEIAAILNP